MKIEKIQDAIVDYFAGAITSEEIARITGKLELEQEVGDIVSLAERQWDEIEVDAEGPTIEQDELLNEVLEAAADEIMALQ